MILQRVDHDENYMRSLYLITLLALASLCQAQEGTALGPDVGRDTVRLDELLDKGKALVYQNPDSALLYLHVVVEQSDSLRAPARSAEAENWAGVAYYVKGEYDRALPFFMEALHFYSQSGDHAGLASGYNHVGLIYQTQMRHGDAIGWHRKGVHHGRLAGDLGSQCRNNFNIGLAFDELGMYDSAFYYVSLSQQQGRASSSHQIVVMAFNRLAKIRFHQGHYALAETLYDSALAHPVGQNNWERAFALAGLAEVYDAQGRHEKAIAAGTKGLNLAFEVDAKWDIIHASEILARAYANHGAPAKAYEMALLMQAYKDTVFNEEKENKLNYIHLKENELMKANLEKENALQLAKLEQRNFQMIMVIVISVSLLAVLLVLFARHREKIKMNEQLLATNKTIAQQNKDLKELNQAKNQLFSIISHDLRTPFANLHGLLTLARSGALDETEREELLEHLEQNFWSVSGTLESLLQWAHNQMEGLKTNPEPIDVDGVIAKTIAFWKPGIEDKELKCVFTRRGFWGFADRYHLQTVVRNIVGNAIKFTPSSGSIFIDTIERSDRLGIRIRDTGVGMPSDIKENLFRFEKATQRSGTAKEKGTGLGLIICQQLLEKNKGLIEVDSEEGKGTTFNIWIPSGNAHIDAGPELELDRAGVR